MGRMLKNKSSSTSSKKPSFFKVMIGDFHEKLRIPTSFTRHFNGKLPHKSILRSPTGRSWTIQVKRIAKNLFFSNGWKEFVSHHSLELGDFLVFRYNGESKFNVKIYGRTGCEKEVHCINHEEPVSNVKKEQRDEEPMANVKKENEGENPEPRKPPMKIGKNAEAGVGGSSTKTKCSHFITIWTHSRKNTVMIPRAFVIENDLKTKKSIILQDPEGRSWPMIISPRADGRATMTNGWQKISEQNRLAEGDAILFEFLNLRKGNKMSVRIFRKAEVKIPARMLYSEGSTSTEVLDLLTKSPKAAYMTTHAEERASSIKTKRSQLIATWRNSMNYHVMIPRALAIENGLKTKKTIILQDPEGRSWPMIISPWADGRVDMTNGWQKFSVENRLVDGDAILFDFLNLRKGNKISVNILRKAEGKIPARLLRSKGYSSTAVLKGSSSTAVRKGSSSTAVLKGSSSTAVLKGSSSTAALDLLTKSPKAAHVTTHAEERAIKAASAFESENPFCKIIMRKSFVHEICQLNVPTAFGNEYLKGKTQVVTLQVSDERMWQVRCFFSGHQTRLYKGWRKFVSDNHLEEGDVCVFELVEGKNFEIKVSIFRVSQYEENIEDRMQSQEKD